MLQFNNEFNFLPDEILVYLRKSRSDDPMLSVEEVLQKHETILDEWAENQLGAKIPEENRFREIVSGETIEARPEIQKLLSMIESPKYKAILVVEVQRLSRGDLEDAGRLIKLLRYTDTLVITPQKTYDLTNEYDRDIFERELKRGNEYLEYQKKIMGRGRLLSVSQGNYIGSIPPYGHDKIWMTEGKRKYPTLKPNEKEAPIVLAGLKLYVNNGWGFKRICNHFDSLGIEPPKGKHWSPSALKEILINYHHIGKVVWNWRKTVTIVEDGEIKKTRPKSKFGEYLIYDGKHPAIVPEDLFYAAIEKQGRNHRAKADTKVKNVFAGLLYCRCGRAMSLRTYKNKDGSERNPPRLVCDDQTYCHTGSCLYDNMVDHISSVLKCHIEDFEVRARIESEDSINFHKELIDNLKNKLKFLQSKELSQWEAQSHPDPSQRMPQEIFQQLNVTLQKEKQEVQQALDTAYETMPVKIDYKKKVAQFKEVLETLNCPDADPEEKNRLLKSCIERIDYYREQPQRLKRNLGEKKGIRFKVGGAWSNPPIEVTVKLNV